MSWESRREWVQGVPGAMGDTQVLPSQESDLVSLDLILTFHFRRGPCLPMIRDRRWQAPTTSGLEIL